MKMTSVLYGLAALPLLAGVALAETPKQSNVAKHPMQLSELQMDKVTAGWDLREIDVFNTGIVWVSVYERTNTAAPVFTTGNTIVCPSCYLLINNFAISVGSQIGR
jgi:hypothetical protein